MEEELNDAKRRVWEILHATESKQRSDSLIFKRVYIKKCIFKKCILVQIVACKLYSSILN